MIRVYRLGTIVPWERIWGRLFQITRLMMFDRAFSIRNVGVGTVLNFQGPQGAGAAICAQDSSYVRYLRRSAIAVQGTIKVENNFRVKRMDRILKRKSWHNLRIKRAPWFGPLNIVLSVGFRTQFCLYSFNNGTSFSHPIKILRRRTSN